MILEAVLNSGHVFTFVHILFTYMFICIYETLFYSSCRCLFLDTCFKMFDFINLHRVCVCVCFSHLPSLIPHPLLLIDVSFLNQPSESYMAGEGGKVLEWGLADWDLLVALQKSKP